MWNIYIIKHNLTGDTYIGRTNNLERRLFEHNSGGQASTRRLNGQWNLVYAEIYRSKEDAVNRELKLKHHGRAKQELKKRIQNSIFEN